MSGKQEAWFRKERQTEREIIGLDLPNTPTSALKMKAACFCEMLILTYKLTQSHNLEDED
jgi:hypothetical protein